MKNQKEFPKEFTDLVGKEWKLDGNIFSTKKQIKPTTFKVLKLRWGASHIVDMNTLKDKHPTIQLLVKNKNMQRSRWTKGFPVRSILL